MIVAAAWSLSFVVNRPTPYQGASQELLKRVLAIPGLRERLQGMGHAQAKATTAQLALKGALRLSDAQLMLRAQLLSEIFQVLDEHNCAEQLRGGRGNIEPALQKIRPDSLRAWFDLAITAITAEMQGAPPASHHPEDEAIALAVLEVVALLPSHDAARFQQVMDDLANASDADVCWATRTRVGSVSKVSPPSQPVLAKVLVLTE